MKTCKNFYTVDGGLPCNLSRGVDTITVELESTVNPLKALGTLYIEGKVVTYIDSKGNDTEHDISELYGLLNSLLKDYKLMSTGLITCYDEDKVRRYLSIALDGDNIVL